MYAIYMHIFAVYTKTILSCRKKMKIIDNSYQSTTTECECFV